jgi:CheY-like chemotaxis protein
MGPNVSNIAVLVVDDEAMIRMYAVDDMEEAGFSVIEAGSGPDALALLDDHPEIRVLFTDIQMPGAFDGMELARRVYSRRPDVQLIITSGNVRPATSEIPDHGQFIAKPYDGQAVTRMIANHQA